MIEIGRPTSKGQMSQFFIRKVIIAVGDGTLLKKVKDVITRDREETEIAARPSTKISELS
jgi:hypothetical protein